MAAAALSRSSVLPPRSGAHTSCRSVRSRRRAAYPHASSSATETISLPRRCCWTETYPVLSSYLGSIRRYLHEAEGQNGRGGGGMRAVVTEIRETSAAVLCEDGQIRLIPAQNFHKGQEITLSAGRRRIRRPLMCRVRRGAVRDGDDERLRGVRAVFERDRGRGGERGIHAQPL